MRTFRATLAQANRDFCPLCVCVCVYVCTCARRSPLRAHLCENIKGVEIRLEHIETSGMTRLNVTPICLDLIMAHPLMAAQNRYRVWGITSLTLQIFSRWNAKWNYKCRFITSRQLVRQIGWTGRWKMGQKINCTEIERLCFREKNKKKIRRIEEVVESNPRRILERGS